MQAVIEYLVKKMTEPSTYIGLGALITAIGWNISPENWQTIANFGLGLGGLLAMIFNERKKVTSGEIKNVVEAVVKPGAVKDNPLSSSALDTAMKQPQEK